jgi:hypothetical protein
MNLSDYPPPVDRLLTLGDRGWFDEWPDYRSEFGLGPEHIPALIRLATDRDLIWGEFCEPEGWGPIHAVRALGQLGALEAVPQLLELMNDLEAHDSDWMTQEFPDVLSMMGPAALPELKAFLGNAINGHWARMVITDALERLAREDPETRADCVAVLTQQLERFAENDGELNGSLISSLTELQAVESAAVIEQAFAANCVDESITGSWEYVRYDLGLGPRPEEPRCAVFPQELQDPPRLLWDRPAQERAEDRRKERKRAKAARKRTAKARRLSRKRR